MQFRLNRHKALLGELQFLHLQLLADEFLTPKFGEVRLREKYFKRVYERMAVEQKANEEAFTIGALAEYILAFPFSECGLCSCGLLVHPL